MANPIDPAAAKAWKAALRAWNLAGWQRRSDYHEMGALVVQAYGDQREKLAVAKVIAWLRRRQEIYRSEYAVSVDPLVREIADAIERGDHLTGGGE